MEANMKNRLKVYVDSLFSELPNTDTIDETKEELIANLIDKYDDYIKEGLSNELAYQKVIASIGDVQELVESDVELDAKSEPKKLSMNTNHYLSVLLFVMTPILLISLSFIEDELSIFGVFIAIVMILLALVFQTRAINEPIKKSKSLMFSVKERQRLRDIKTIIYLMVTMLVIGSFLTKISVDLTLYLVGYAISLVIELYMMLKKVNQFDPQEIELDVYSLSSRIVFTIAALIFFSGAIKLSVSWLVFVGAALITQLIKISLKKE